MDDRRTMMWPSRVSRAMFCCCAAAMMTAVVMAGGGEGAAVKRSDTPCPENGCAAIQCPRGDQDAAAACPLGLVPDGCACCPYGVCGLGEGLECNAVDRPCGNDLDCVKTENSDTMAVYRCECKEKEPTCGSDNKTYSNGCHLNEAAAKLGYNGSLWIQYRGPCQSGPVIKSFSKNFSSSIGQPVIFDCEIEGYPVPSISWRFTDSHGITKWLPGDDTLIAIQTRGGPDRFTTTSWVQIIESKSIHTGNYTCLGTNQVNTATATAVLDVKKII